jgi:LysR family transcriptional regulator, nod-box dependent transcriptional activator
MLVETDRIALVHERMARFYETILPLRSVAPPFELPPMREMVQFHSARADDQGLRWVLDLLKLFVSGGSISVLDQ